MKPADRRYVVGGSPASAIIGGNEASFIWREKRGDEPESVSKRHCYGASLGQTPVCSNIEALFCANAAFFVGRLLRMIVQILLLFVTRNKRLHNSARGNAASNQLVRLNAQEKLK